jgi:hypothetical protein
MLRNSQENTPYNLQVHIAANREHQGEIQSARLGCRVQYSFASVHCAIPIYWKLPISLAIHRRGIVRCLQHANT